MTNLVSHLLAFVLLQTKMSQDDVACFKHIIKCRMYILFIMDTHFFGCICVMVQKGFEKRSCLHNKRWSFHLIHSITSLPQHFKLFSTTMPTISSTYKLSLYPISEVACIKDIQFNIHAKVNGLLHIDEDPHSKPIALALILRLIHKLLCFAHGKGAVSFLSWISISSIHTKFSMFNKGRFNSYREVENHLNIAY